MLLPQAAADQTSPSSFLPDPARRVHWLTLLLLLAACAAIRFLFLARKPFWFDECFSVEVARLDRRNLLHLLWWREANMSLYYLLLRIWLRFESPNGQSEFFIRGLSVLIAAATLPAIYWLARLLYDRRVALIAAALFTFNAYSVRYAQEARSYALLLLLATLSSGFLIAYVREPGRRNRRAYILVSILAVYAHFYALLLVVAQWLALRRLGNGARGPSQTQPEVQPTQQMRRAWITIGLAVSPLLIFVAKTGAGPIRWIQHPGLRDVLAFYEHLAGGSNWALLIVCAAACTAALLPVGRQLWAPDQSWETWRIHFLLVWLFFPVVLTVLLSFARPVFLGRYMIFCLPALLILVAAGLARLRPSWLLAVALTGIFLLGSQGISFVYGNDFDNERDASVAAAAFILDHAQPEDAVIFHIAGTRIPYEFVRSLRAGENTASPSFAAQLGPEILFPYHGAGLDYRDFTGKPSADFLRTAAPSHPRVWIMLMNNAPAGDPDPTTVMLTQVLPELFPKMLRWQFTKAEVRLYSHE
ncbi:MAG TPA: glycosyltransferase family 39 protein [Candidatus Sulfotelmatobacter sp.]|nr:glycosyltransferase family 39 protein [Candidatus Sulfotelmatobacter sp.]